MYLTAGLTTCLQPASRKLQATLADGHSSRTCTSIASRGNLAGSQRFGHITGNREHVW